MKESGYYPPGAEFDPKAPWNQEETPMKTFDVFCSQTLSKEVEVRTNDYVQEDEIDEDGHYQGDFVDTTDTNWVEAYDKDHYTLEGLIKAFATILEEMLKRKDYSYVTEKEAKEFLEECNGWSVDETVIEKSN